MAQYNPPSQNLPIFDSGLFGGTNSTTGSVPSGDFLNFPNAQGDENLLGITVADSATFNADSTFNDVVEINDDTTFSTNIIMSGTYLTNYIEFPDGTQQFSANGSGSGDALLAGGTLSNPQTFTGYNEFSNADGQITLINTTETPISFVTISCDQTEYQVNIGGNLAIGNTANSNLVRLSSAADYTGQLDIHGYINITNASDTHAVRILTDEANIKQLNIQGALSVGNSTNSNTVLIASDTTNSNQIDIYGTVKIDNPSQTNPIFLTNFGDPSTGQYGLQITNGGIKLGSFTGTPSASTYVSISCLDSTDGVFYVQGNINATGTYLTIGSVSLTTGGPGLQLSSGLGIGGNCILNNTVSGTPSSSTLSQSSSVVETIVANGSLQLFGGDTYRSFFYNYTGQTDLETFQNLDENLEVLSGLSISPNKYAYPGSTNRVNLFADGVTNNQLTLSGSLQTTGQVIITGTGAGITFPDSSVQTTAYTGGSPVLATYTSSALDTGISPYNWSFDGISNSLGNQVNWILYSNSAMTVSSASAVYTDLDPIVQPSALNNYIFGSGTAIQIPYKYSDGTTTTTQPTYYPSAVVALGGFTISAIADASVNSTFRVSLNSTSNTSFTNGSTLTLKFFAN